MYYILLPVFNEERYIVPILQRIGEAMRALHFDHYKVLLVNDGSTDGTAVIL